jgi:hypothetical protein
MVKSMATLTQLIEVVAAMEGIGRERVAAIARAVREDGLIATHGRGPSAARMTERDAANLLIAANVADIARSAPESVRRYRALMAASGNRTGEFGRELEKMLSAAKEQALQDYLIKLVNAFGPAKAESRKEKTYPRYEMELQFDKPRASATIWVRIPSVAVGSVRFDSVDEDRTARRIVDRRESIVISQQFISSVGLVLNA